MLSCCHVRLVHFLNLFIWHGLELLMTSLLRIIGILLKLVVELIGGSRVWVDTRRRLVASISLQKLNL